MSSRTILTPTISEGKLNRMDRLDPNKKKYLENCNYQHCKLISDKYILLKTVGEGNYGEVYKARLKDCPDQFVALKKIKIKSFRSGFPITALREVNILKNLEHPNIVKLVEICKSRASETNKWYPLTYLVLEYCDYTLSDITFNKNVDISLVEAKYIFYYIFNGLFYLHFKKILHRDLKNSNVLINKDGVVKIADFGLARDLCSIDESSQQLQLSGQVVTMSYKAPELLLGDRNYGPGIDLWSAGCMLVEIFVRHVLFEGSTEQAVLMLISNLCGTITEMTWPRLSKLPGYALLNLPEGDRHIKMYLRQTVKDEALLDLVDRLLTLDPKQRIDTLSALAHDFFRKDPPPQPILGLLARYHLQTTSKYLSTPESLS